MTAPTPKPAPAAEAPAKSYEMHVLDRGMLLMQREADSIEIWQRNREGLGVEVPKERWDARMRAEHKLFLDLAQLCHLVRLLEPEFKKLVSAKLGDRRRAAAKETPTDGNAPEAAVEPPAD